jgi:UDP-N-acetylglucosamine 2-epimerase (non-hydrolysing)
VKVINIVGARPNFMKAAPVVSALQERTGHHTLLLHTGQHYDRAMSTLFFEELGLPEPDVNLGVGSGSHAQQTAKIMLAFEEVVLQEKPDLIIVYGDVNSTIACTLVASKLQVKIAHVEAGLRSYDRTMPEEINRLLTDQVADFLFTTSRDACDNLRKEGISPEKIFFVGNPMIDTLLKHEEKAERSNILSQLGLAPHMYGLATLHRPSNVDNPQVLRELLSALETIQQQITLVLPLHPRMKQRLQDFGFDAQVKAMPNVLITAPLGYLDFLKLMKRARFVLTDSGGVQEETTVLGVPCLTMRENTERPVTVLHGTNRLIGTNPQNIVSAANEILQGHARQGQIPELWDGQAGKRIVTALLAIV